MYKVSVVIPCYNCETTLVRAVSSALVQGSDVEVILIEDCSTDGTKKVAQRLADSHENIKLIGNDKNMGPAFSRNRGLDSASGKYIAFLDSDDIWLPGKIKSQVSYMEENGLEFSYHDYYEASVQDNQVISVKLSQAPEVAELPSYYYKRGFGMCLTSMISRSACSSIRFLEDRNIFTEDYLFFLCLLSSGVKGRRIPLSLGVYTVLRSSRSSNKIRQAKSVLRSNLIASDGTVKPIYYFVIYAFANVLGLSVKEKSDVSAKKFAEVVESLGLIEHDEIGEEMPLSV